MNKNRFEQLIPIIQSLEENAKAIDNKFGEHTSARFDRTLFQCNSKLLLPCVKELNQTFNELAKEIDSTGKNTPSTIEYLSERLLNQISAIQREIATVGLRRKEPKVFIKGYTLDDLYQQLSQHQDWERRLQQMLLDKSDTLTSSVPEHRQAIQQQIINLEQRLARCQQAKNQLEKKIALRERKG